MKKQAKNFLFISEGYSSGSNSIIQLAAEKLIERGHNVQVMMRHGTTPDHMNTIVPSELYFDVYYSWHIDENTDQETGQKFYKKHHLSLNHDHIFFSNNSTVSYTRKDHIFNLLKFIPDYIIVGNRHNFLTYDDLDQLSNGTGAMVYLLALDMSHLTGGCHFAWDCEGYKIGCDQVKCPALINNENDGIATENFINKQEIFVRGNFRLIAGTQWTKSQAQKSKLFKDQKRVHNIPAFIDVDIFNNKSRQLARQVLDLSNDHFYILAGSENPKDKRKGYKYFVEAMKLLWQSLSENERQKIVILSVSKYKNQAFQEISFDKKHVDYIKDERLLSYLYQSADLYINTSIEDSGPSMLMEALVCGTPVVSFKMGAAEEFIQHGENGYLTDLYDSNALAEHIYDYIKLPPAIQQKFRDTAHESTVQRVDHNHALDKLIRYLQEEELSTTVSVAMCTYNGERYLREQLESIINQNQPVQEIIICDDGSTDRTIEIINLYQEKYPNLIYLHVNETNLGTVKNFEKAINLCTQDIIFLSDQDDIWHTHKIRTVLKYFQNNEDIEAIFHDLHITFEDGKIEDYTMWDSLYYDQKARDQIPLYDFLVLFSNVVTGMAMAIRKPKSPLTFCDRGELMFLHDYQLALKYAKEEKLAPINVCLGKYRQHDNQQLGCVTDHPFVDYITFYESPFHKHMVFNNRIKLFKTISPESKNRSELLDWLSTARKQHLNQEGYWKITYSKVLETGYKPLKHVLFIALRSTIKKTLHFLGLWEKFDKIRRG